MEKRLITFIIVILAALEGCDKKTTPLLNEPSSYIYAISGVCTQVETKNFPNTRAFCSIADQNNVPLFDFAKGNFSLVEEGKPVVVEEVKKVDNNEDPLSVVLVLDRSGSMSGPATSDLDVAAIHFVNQLGPRDECEIINFTTTVTVSQPFTSDHHLLENGITSYSDMYNTAFFDAVGQAATDLSSRNGRKFILAMTDGYENASRDYNTMEEIKSYVNSKGLSVFIVGLGYDIDKDMLRELASDSGGRYFEAATSVELDNLYQQALTQFNNEVSIKFRSLSKGARHLRIYMNYGSFNQSFEKKYSD
ncbi:MAG: VWA domain-containing protein [bacterium]|nr:VWA domain-containing protein [bacterium]MDD5354248.1 VWA domain-containing protein [bacterium]MDD5756065.1 VWA domain-containing protein [bacterium]